MAGAHTGPSGYERRSSGVIIAICLFVSVHKTLLTTFVQLVVFIEQGQCGATKGNGMTMGAFASGWREVPEGDGQTGIFGKSGVIDGQGQPLGPFALIPEPLVGCLDGNSQRLGSGPDLDGDIEVRVRTMRVDSVAIFPDNKKQVGVPLVRANMSQIWPLKESAERDGRLLSLQTHDANRDGIVELVGARKRKGLHDGHGSRYFGEWLSAKSNMKYVMGCVGREV